MPAWQAEAKAGLKTVQMFCFAIEHTPLALYQNRKCSTVTLLSHWVQILLFEQVCKNQHRVALQ